MHALSGRQVLVTGASGVVAFPVAKELAKTQRGVRGGAVLRSRSRSRMLEEAGAHPIAFDLADPDLSPLPESVDVVINYAVLPPQKNAYEVNAGAAGRLAGATGTAKPSCTAAPVRSTNTRASAPCARTIPMACTRSAENYAASKIAAEFLLKHLSVDYQLPVVMVRIFSFYGPRGGGVTQRIDQIHRRSNR